MEKRSCGGHLEEGDPAAKEEIVRRYLPYAQRLVSPTDPTEARTPASSRSWV
jgi:hypothetical protein